MHQRPSVLREETLQVPKPHLTAADGLELSVSGPYFRFCRPDLFLRGVVYTAQRNSLCPRQTHARAKESVEA